jgi:hypothetical protein
MISSEIKSAYQLGAAIDEGRLGAMSDVGSVTRWIIKASK